MNYLGSPYTHPDPIIREERYLRALKVLADLLRKGKWTYSPIVHCHEMAKVFSLGTDHLSWKQYNYHMMTCAKHTSGIFYVLRIEGWDTSAGLKDEMLFASQIDLKTIFI